jgi:pyrroline-5-carboxylate reductase
MLKQKIAVIGAGMMGSTIIDGLLRSGNSSRENITAAVRTAKSAEKVKKHFGIATFTDNLEAAKGADIIIVAVKPKEVVKVVKSFSKNGILKEEPLILSIAAGVSTGIIEEITGTHLPVVRAMPNTPCLIGAGVTAICAGSGAKKKHMDLAHTIFEALGRCVEVQEKHMDAVTGLSASGPAYVYLIIEALADGGVMMGLPRKTALELVTHMVIGAARMVDETDKHPASLKDDVTTPAGCTISGILTLEDGKIRSVLARAVQIAALRAGELAQ